MPFSQVADSEKRQFAGDIKKTGSYRGYKLRHYWVRFRFPQSPHTLDLALSKSGGISTLTMACETNLSITIVSTFLKVPQILIPTPDSSAPFYIRPAKPSDCPTATLTRGSRIRRTQPLCGASSRAEVRDYYHESDITFGLKGR